MAGVAGFEPTITESESVALPLGDTPKGLWGGEWDSNPRSSEPQSDALTS